VNGVLGQFWKEEFPQMGRMSINIPRVMSEASLAELFSPDLGYAQPVMVNDFDLIIDTSLDGLWDFFAATYVIAFLEGDAMQRLESRMKAHVAEHQAAHGSLQLPMPLSQITVRTRG
jgi:hypothetical protein